jgi:hypothetical protein
MTLSLSVSANDFPVLGALKNRRALSPVMSLGSIDKVSRSTSLSASLRTIA